eukprot:Skav206178  [mRNA]  locus=scaffold3070:52245:67250:- [translate_table: standard]
MSALQQLALWWQRNLRPQGSPSSNPFVTELLGVCQKFHRGRSLNPGAWPDDVWSMAQKWPEYFKHDLFWSLMDAIELFNSSEDEWTAHVLCLSGLERARDDVQPKVSMDGRFQVVSLQLEYHWKMDQETTIKEKDEVFIREDASLKGKVIKIENFGAGKASKENVMTRAVEQELVEITRMPWQFLQPSFRKFLLRAPVSATPMAEADAEQQVSSLQDDYLIIQGPPGTISMAFQLPVAKVLGNDETPEELMSEGFPIGAAVLGGTASQLMKLVGTFEYLFVDEAGQRLGCPQRASALAAVLHVDEGRGAETPKGGRSDLPRAMHIVCTEGGKEQIYDVQLALPGEAQVRLDPTAPPPTFAAVPRPWAVHPLPKLPGFALSAGLQAPVELQVLALEAAPAAELIKDAWEVAKDGHGWPWHGEGKDWLQSWPPGAPLWPSPSDHQDAMRRTWTLGALGPDDQGEAQLAEAYELRIEDETDGFLRGVASLRQLFGIALAEGWSRVPAQIIRDKPRFSHRGLMLDVSRHFFGVSFVKRLLET